MATVFADRRSDAFLNFLDRLSKGQCDRDDWDQFVLTHYVDERLEEARREIVTGAMSVEDLSWEHPMPEAVKNTAVGLLNMLSHKE